MLVRNWKLIRNLIPARLLWCPVLLVVLASAGVVAVPAAEVQPLSVASSEPPAAPSGLAAAAGDGSVALAWDDPSDSTITGYEYRVNHNDTSTGDLSGWGPWIAVPDSGAATVSHMMTGLTNDAEYRFRVRAVNAAGSGPQAPGAHPWFVAATPRIVEPPAAPSGLAAAAGDGSVALVWDDPSDSTITGYEYRVNHNDTSTGDLSGWGPWIAVPDSGAATTAHTMGGLANGREYRYRLRSVNTVGGGAVAPGAYPWYVTATPQPALLDPPTPPPPPVTPPQPPVTPPPPPPVTPPPPPVTPPPPPPPPVTPLPSAPSGLAAAIGNAGVTLGWDDPSDSSITGYEYRMRWTGVAWGEWTPIPGSDAATVSHTIDGLPNGVEHRFRLRAVNTAGPGPAAPNAHPWFVSATPQEETPTLTVVDLTSTGATITLSHYTGSWYYHIERQPSDETNAGGTGGASSANGAGGAGGASGANGAGGAGGASGANGAGGAGGASSAGGAGGTNTAGGASGAGGANACLGPVSGGEATITGLAPGSGYAVTAYVGGCGGAVAAQGQFTTTSPVLNVPQPPALSGVVSISGWSHDWWLEETADNTIACRHVPAGGVVSVAFPGGTGPVWRQYKAYGKSGCNDHAGARDLIASGHYSRAATIYLTSDKVSADSAELRINGFRGNWSLKRVGPDEGRCRRGYSWRYPAKLRNLSSATTYTYTAYRYFSCAPGSKLHSVTFTTASSSPSPPTAPTLESGNGKLAASWAVPHNGGSAIFYYEVRYRETGTATWSDTNTLATYSPGALGGNRTTDGGNGDALDLGSVSLPGLTVTKPTLTGVSDVYLLGSAVAGLRVQVSGTENSVRADWRARYASTAPTASNMNNHGTQIWRLYDPGNSFTGNGWTGPLPAGTYFWVARTGDPAGYVTNVTPVIQAKVPVSGTSGTITGLTNGTGYEVQVRAVNALGTGGWSAAATLKSGLPAAPAEPSLASGNARLSASWTAPSGNGSPITGYDVQYCSAGCGADSGWTDVAHSGTTAAASITGLTNGTSYWVRVRAENSVGTGPWSVSATLAAGAPAAPADLALASGNAQLTASWTAAVDNGSSVTDYDVRYRIKDVDSVTAGDQPGPWLEMPDTTDSTATSAVISDATNGSTHPALVNDTAYEVQTRAGNARGDGGWSTAVADKPGRPQQTATPTLTAGTRKLSVTWTAPTVNGLPVTDYDVRYRKASDTAWTSHPHTGTGTSAEITGLEAAAYQVQVRASSSAGAGPWSASASATPSAGTPDTPAAPVLQAGSARITAEWAAPYDGGSAITDYDVRTCSSSCATDSNWSEWNPADTSTATTAVITGLTNGTEYEVRVRATNTHGDSGWSPSASLAAGVPGTVGAPTLAIGDGKLTVSWTAPAPNAGVIDDYDIRYRKKGTASWTRVLAPGVGNHNFNFPGEQDSVNNTDNPLDWGSLGSQFTKESLGANSGLYKTQDAIDEMQVSLDPYFPGASGVQIRINTSSGKPTGNLYTTGTVLATAGGGSSTRPRLRDQWVGPIAENGYIWVASSRSAQTSAVWSREVHGIDLASTATSDELGGLVNGTEYEVQVRAGNTHGDGGWSPTATATPVKTLKVSGVTATTATLAITSHTGDWHYKQTSPPGGVCSAAVSAAAVAVTGLTADTAYAFKAYSDSSCSTELRDAVRFTTADPALASSGVTATTATLTLSGWVAGTGAGKDGNWHYKANRAPHNTCQGPVTAATAGLTGLTPGISHTYKAYTDSACTAANEIASAAFTTLAAPGSPANVGAQYQDGSLKVWWDRPSGASGQISYSVECNTNINPSTYTSCHTQAASTTASFTATISNSNVGSVRVRSTQHMANSAWATSAVPSGTVPGAPTEVDFTTSTSGSTVTYTVRWTKPASPAGAVGYQMQCSTNATAWNSCKTITATSNTDVNTTVTRTTSETAYTHVRVRTVKSKLISSWTTGTAAVAPGSPANLGAQYQDGSLKVWWDRPSGASGKISYSVQCSTDSGTTYTSCHTQAASTTASFTATISTTGATNARVRSTRRTLSSAWATSAVPSGTAPGAPTNLTYTLTPGTKNQTSITATWTKPSSPSGAVSYQMQYYDDLHASWSSGGTVTATSNTTVTHTHQTALPHLLLPRITKVRVRTVANKLVGAWTEITG